MGMSGMFNTHSTLGQSIQRGGLLRLWAAAAIFLALASTAPAGVIDVNNVPVGIGTSFGDLGFATVTATGQAGEDTAFYAKTIGSYTGFGIGGGYSTAEIDLKGEKLTVEYDNPTVITELILSFLYPNLGWDDVVNEVARVTVVAPTSLVGELTALTSTTANWSGAPSLVTNLDPAVNPSAGVWKISMPFGSQLVQKLEFTAVAVPGGPIDATNSDFGIVSITNSDNEVPEAASVLLTGLGLVLLGGISRKWRSKPSDK
jgi:hypothetical protein